MSWWTFTGRLLAASILRSPGHLLSILADISNAVVWIISILTRISSSTSLFWHETTIPSTPTTSGITVTFHVPLLFQFSGKIQVFTSLFAFFYFPSVVRWKGKIHKTVNSLFLKKLTLGLVFWWRLGDPSVSQNPMDIL